VKIDIGCGPNKKEGFIGLDQYKFDGVDHVVQIGSERLPFDDGTVEEVHASHFVEHLDAKERCHLFNELHRVMAVGAKMTMIVPHWGSSRAYGDPTHKWPPIGEFWFYYLSKAWRDGNAPHTNKENWPDGYDCDFEATWGYSTHPSFQTRNQEFQMFAMNHYREGAQDIHATIIRK
jgi:hypothetical protein